LAITELLIRKGADTRQVNKEGRRAIDVAEDNNHHDLAVFISILEEE
jgi:ankyrin repeat protein